MLDESEAKNLARDVLIKILPEDPLLSPGKNPGNADLEKRANTIASYYQSLVSAFLSQKK